MLLQNVLFNGELPSPSAFKGFLPEQNNFVDNKSVREHDCIETKRNGVTAKNRQLTDDYHGSNKSIQRSAVI